VSEPSCYRLGPCEVAAAAAAACVLLTEIPLEGCVGGGVKGISWRLTRASVGGMHADPLTYGGSEAWRG
jgi:hypothetical protein